MKITEDKYIEILEIQGISYNKNSKWFTVSLERINEAINYTRCCKSDSEQLKDKQELSFDEWTKKNKYTVIAPTLYKKGLEYVNIESLNRQYKKHLNL